MKTIVYPVIATYVDDNFRELNNVYPTAESAIAWAKKIAQDEGICEVEVTRAELTEEYGLHWLADIYEEKHEDR